MKKKKKKSKTQNIQNANQLYIWEDCGIGVHAMRNRNGAP